MDYSRDMMAKLLLAQHQPTPQPNDLTGIPDRNILSEELMRGQGSPLRPQPGQIFRPPLAPAPQLTPEQLQALPPSARDAYSRTWGSGS